MKSNIGIYNINDIHQTGENKSFILPVRIIDIIISEDHPDWKEQGGWDALGLIKFNPFYEETKDNNNSNNWAKPLFANIKNYPLVGELTYVIHLPDPTVANDPYYASYYYINSINIWNHPHHNAFPNINFSDLPADLQLNYKEIESGLVKQQLDKSKDFRLGNTFVEKSNIKPVLPFEGDVILEGRFGQSFRFGSTVKNKNPWSSIGDNGDPITIIKNGQSSVKSIDSDKGWIPTLEDINNDGSSIYMTQGQAIPIKVASLNMKSFNTILQEATYPIIQISDNPLPTTSSLPTASLSPTASQKVYNENELSFTFPGEESQQFVFDSENIDEETINNEIKREIYNSTIMSNESSLTKNDKGEYALYNKGVVVEYSPIVFIGGIRIATKYEPYVKIILAAAAKEGIPLKLNSGLRTYDEQLVLRKQNLKDKTKINDLHYLTTALSSNFSPQTGAPGFSNHQNGRAIDVNTGIPTVYKWMVSNAIKYGYVRTVPSERWHWEYLPGTSQFSVVPKEHPTWDKLV